MPGRTQIYWSYAWQNSNLLRLCLAELRLTDVTEVMPGKTEIYWCNWGYAWRTEINWGYAWRTEINWGYAWQNSNLLRLCLAELKFTINNVRPLIWLRRVLRIVRTKSWWRIAMVSIRTERKYERSYRLGCMESTHGMANRVWLKAKTLHALCELSFYKVGNKKLQKMETVCSFKNLHDEK